MSFERKGTTGPVDISRPRSCKEDFQDLITRMIFKSRLVIGKKTIFSFESKSSISLSLSFKLIGFVMSSVPCEWDIILCRNVLIYFSKKAVSFVTDRFFETLKDDGYFVMSPVETVPKRQSGFRLQKEFRHYFYKKSLKQEENMLTNLRALLEQIVNGVL